MVRVKGDVTSEGTEPGRAAVRRHVAPTSERARPESGTARGSGESDGGLRRLRRARGERADADRSPQAGEGAQSRCVGVTERVHGSDVEAHEVVGYSVAARATVDPGQVEGGITLAAA